MLKNIQVLRGLAALLVVVGHLEPLFRGIDPSLALVGLGKVGVDLFFVISGFVMVYTTNRTAPSALEFAQRRIIRIVPLYWLVTLGVFALSLAAPRLLTASRPDPTWLMKSMAFVPFAKGDGTFNPLVPVGWTLNYEMFFYAIFSLCLLAGVRLRYWLAGGLIVALAAPGFDNLDLPGVAAQFYTRPILAVFAAGMALAGLATRLPAIRSRLGAAALLACALALLAGLLASGVLPLESWRVAVALPAAVGLMACALVLERGGCALKGPLVTVGDASYSIYLTHLFVTQAAIAIAFRLGWVSGATALLAILAALAGVIVAGVACYRLFEVPVTRALRAFPALRPAAA
jgi:peptidoglycan/LPS O-acetylase OafA/YrhL